VDTHRGSSVLRCYLWMEWQTAAVLDLICCLLSAFQSFVCCLLSAVYCELSTVPVLLSVSTVMVIHWLRSVASLCSSAPHLLYLASFTRLTQPLCEFDLSFSSGSSQDSHVKSSKCTSLLLFARHLRPQGTLLTYYGYTVGCQPNNWVIRA
jgi:hypothetical protein